MKRILLLCLTLMLLPSLSCRSNSPSLLWFKGEMMPIYFKNSILILSRWKKSVERVEIESGRTIWTLPTTEEILVDEKNDEIFLIDTNIPSIRKINLETGQATEKRTITREDNNVELEKAIFQLVDDKIYFFKSGLGKKSINILDSVT